MSRILLLLDHAPNRRLLAGALGTRHEVVLARTADALDEPFDLCLLDGPAVDRLWERVHARKLADQPRFLPFLLVTSRRDVGMATRHLWQTIDEVIFRPVNKLELLARVESLLRARSVSSELEALVAERTQALRESEARYRQLLDAAPIGIAVHQDGRLVFANLAGAKLLGAASPADLVGIPIADIVHPDEFEEAKRRIGRMLAGEQGLYPVEQHYRRLDGSVIPVDVMAARLIYGGKPAVQVMVTDTSARKRAEAERDRLFNLSVDMLAISGLDGFFKQLNPAWRRTLGWDDAELLRRPWIEFVHPDDVARTVEALERLNTGQPVIAFENRYRCKDGSYRWISWNSSPLAAEGMAFAVARDITAHKQAEAALRESEERLRLFIEHAPAALAMFDQDMRYLAASRRWVADYGLGDREVVGRAHYEIFPEISDRWKDVHRRALAGEVVRADEDRFERRDGTAQWLRWEVRPWRAADGTIGGIVIFSEDITARKEADAALLESEARYRTLVEVSPEAVFVNDSNRITFINAAGLALFGAARYEQVIGHAPFEFFHPDYHDIIRERVALMLYHRQRVPLIEEKIIRLDGTMRDVEVAGAPFDERGRPVVQVVLRDITDRKQAEAERGRLQEALRRSEVMAAMGSLVAGVAHEVRNPLFGISATLDALEARFADRDDYRQYLTVLRGEARRLTALMQDLIEYGRPYVPHLAPGPLDAVLAAAAHGCEAVSQQTGVRIVMTGASGLRVNMDRERLERAFQNLLQNAVQLSPPGAVVAAGLREVAVDGRTAVECAIEDRGPGFSAADLPRIFEPFFSRRKGGTGLGLSIVQRIVEAHGGKVSARNRTGGGAIVVVQLPAAE